ncbi:MAG: aminodeoxychorismate synthase component I [Gammaproteobacteria bacterium]
MKSMRTTPSNTGSSYHPDYPLVYEIAYLAPQQLFTLFAHEPYAVLLESAQFHSSLGRYSFIAVAPFATLVSKKDQVTYQNASQQMHPFRVLEQHLTQYKLRTWPELPPFQGGMIGYLAYDLCRYLEKIPAQTDEFDFPEMQLGCYDLVLGFDHVQQRTWLFSSGLPENNPKQRQNRAQIRGQWLLQKLKKIPTATISNAVCSIQTITANFSEQTYCNVVQQALRFIEAGDIFQVNLSQRFTTVLPESLTPFELYCRLSQLNSAPFASYLNFGTTKLASASPERFLRLNNGHVETRPIKGTSPRETSAQHDHELAQQLVTNEKERAENIMIVDLLRNDLSRVCRATSVQVPQLCTIESYATVHHLVSVIEGQLRKDCNALSLLQATWPGGSISGVPKVRAMEIIAELEPTARGPYCGCIGYWGYDGNMDTAITIRTFAIKNNQVIYQAGGGITAASNPVAEYQETLLKARALQCALTEIST